jgi:hypothetical protein
VLERRLAREHLEDLPGQPRAAHARLDDRDHRHTGIVAAVVTARSFNRGGARR